MFHLHSRTWCKIIQAMLPCPHVTYHQCGKLWINWRWQWIGVSCKSITKFTTNTIIDIIFLPSYIVYTRGMFGGCLGCGTFKCCVFGSPFTLVTDHQPLKWFMEFNQLIWELARWVFICQEYEFDVKHWARTINKDANGLSTNPSSNELDTTKPHWHGEPNLETMFG